MGLGELDKSDIAAMDQAHHIYTYNLEVNEAVQVDIRLDFGNSQNVEVQDDENVLDENGNKIVVASIMPRSSHTVASIKAYDTDWVIQCYVTMVKRSAPLDIQLDLAAAEKGRVDQLIEKAKLEWKTDPVCLMSEDEIRAKVQH